MTEHIKSAIADFQEWIDRAEEFNPNVQSEHVKAMKLVIRSLQAWEEVLQELEEMKCEYDCTTNEFQRGAKTGANFIRNKAIDIIKQKLSEIEE